MRLFNYKDNFPYLYKDGMINSEQLIAVQDEHLSTPSYNHLSCNYYSGKTKPLIHYEHSLDFYASLVKKQKHTTAGIRWWSPTQLLTGRRVA